MGYYDEYVGKRIKENYEDIAIPILSKGKAEFNSTDDWEIDVILLDREFEEYGETFQLTCHLIISLDDGIITDVSFESRVWGGDGLGDVNPDEICTSTEMKRMGRTEEALLKAITEDA
ncbi:MAG: hypothetical protein IKO00_00730 [Oscillospiraceae bacterium]|nr:hypothetical protein [Oscillospiraceae bacterium]